MSDMTSNGRSRRCPICGRGILRPRLISEVFEYGEDGDNVLVRTQNVPVEDCDVCGESFSGPKAARIRHDAIGRALGLLTPQEVRAIRERLGRSLDGFARLIGVKVDRLSQWESGMVWQDRTADRLLRLIARNHENVAYLESVIVASREENERMKTEEEFTGSTESTSAGSGKETKWRPISAVPPAIQIERVLPEDMPAPPSTRLSGVDVGGIPTPKRHDPPEPPPS
jgi:putative zinc finger/helix-turn-helix YgiT family protein